MQPPNTERNPGSRPSTPNRRQRHQKRFTAADDAAASRRRATPSIPTADPSVEVPLTTEIADIPVAPFITGSLQARPQITPAFIDATHRQYANPISYLGGPQLQARNRTSIESILSLD